MATTAQPTVSISGLFKSFGKAEVLKGVSIDVYAGEVVAIIGPSGSGKTTLLRCINFLESYDGGSIKLDGVEVGYRDVTARRPRPERELSKLRADTAMVFQQFNLFPHLSARDNVALGLRRVRGLPAAEARKRAVQWLGRVGLGHKSDALPYELSGGQQQRVGIARAVAMEPKVLLLDEITSALDPELVGEVLEVVRELAAEGRTMILVTHEMAFARDTATRVVFMDEGVVAVEGTPQDVFETSTHPRLRTFLARFGRESTRNGTGAA